MSRNLGLKAPSRKGCVIHVVRILQDAATRPKPKKDRSVHYRHANGTVSLRWWRFTRLLAYILLCADVYACIGCKLAGFPWFIGFLLGLAALVVVVALTLGALRVFAHFSSKLNTPAQTIARLAFDTSFNKVDPDATAPYCPFPVATDAD